MHKTEWSQAELQVTWNGDIYAVFIEQGVLFSK